MNGLLNQPPSGGCVLKQLENNQSEEKLMTQPPSGGCVLKRKISVSYSFENFQPPSGGCVLKLKAVISTSTARQPAAFGRLCVETVKAKHMEARDRASRLRAAVC